MVGSKRWNDVESQRQTDISLTTIKRPSTDDEKRRRINVKTTSWCCAYWVLSGELELNQTVVRITE